MLAFKQLNTASSGEFSYQESTSLRWVLLKVQEGSYYNFEKTLVQKLLFFKFLSWYNQYPKFRSQVYADGFSPREIEFMVVSFLLYAARHRTRQIIYLNLF